MLVGPNDSQNAAAAAAVAPAAHAPAAAAAADADAAVVGAHIDPETDPEAGSKKKKCCTPTICCPLF